MHQDAAPKRVVRLVFTSKFFNIGRSFGSPSPGWTGETSNGLETETPCHAIQANHGRRDGDAGFRALGLREHKPDDRPRSAM